MAAQQDTTITPASDAAQDPAQPLLTIVVPVYNRAALVGRTLDSIAAQTLRPLSVILVDNASTDASKAVMHKWVTEHDGVNGLDVRLLDENASGACAARNRGLEEVTTPWVMFFDSDDTMAPEHCANAVNAAAAHPEADIIGWDVLYGKEGGPWKRLTFLYHDLAYNNMFNSSLATQRYMCRTALMREIGGWDPEVLVWNDIELGARLAQKNPRCHKIKYKEPTVHIFITENSLTGGGFGARPEDKIMALNRIKRYVPREWTALKGTILSAYCTRDKSLDGRGLMESYVFMAKKGWHRRMMRFAYYYTLHGHRGIARILKPVLAKQTK